MPTLLSTAVENQKTNWESQMKFGMVQYKSAQSVWVQLKWGMDHVSVNRRY